MNAAMGREEVECTIWSPTGTSAWSYPFNVSIPYGPIGK